MEPVRDEEALPRYERDGKRWEEVDMDLIGGLKEKLLAALRAGITTVFIPKDNEKDLADIPDSVKKALKIHPVSHVDQVISQALVRVPEPITWVEPEEAPVPAAESEKTVRPH